MDLGVVVAATGQEWVLKDLFIIELGIVKSIDGVYPQLTCLHLEIIVLFEAALLTLPDLVCHHFILLDMRDEGHMVALPLWCLRIDTRHPAHLR